MKIPPTAPENSIHPKSRSEWRTWLERNHQRESGVWLIRFKKSVDKPRVEYHEAVEEALCFGWIDSKPNKLDDERSMLWFAPRKAKTGWSRINKRRVEKMISENLMTSRGFEKISAAKEDGSWNLLDAIERLDIPPDLEEAFLKFKKARENFNAFPPSVKRGILEWLLNAKKPETRAKRIEETARLAQENIRANQWRKQ